MSSMQQQLQLTQKDALLAVTTLSFDIAGLEMFLPLIAGARIELASRENVMDRNLADTKAWFFRHHDYAGDTRYMAVVNRERLARQR